MSPSMMLIMNEQEGMNHNGLCGTSGRDTSALDRNWWNHEHGTVNNNSNINENNNKNNHS